MVLQGLPLTRGIEGRMLFEFRIDAEIVVNRKLFAQDVHLVVDMDPVRIVPAHPLLRETGSEILLLAAQA